MFLCIYMAIWATLIFVPIFMIGFAKDDWEWDPYSWERMSCPSYLPFW